MSKFKYALLSLLAAIAVLCIAASTAFAAGAPPYTYEGTTDYSYAASVPIPITHTMHAGETVDLDGIVYDIGLYSANLGREKGGYETEDFFVKEWIIEPSSTTASESSTATTRQWAFTPTLADLFGSDDPDDETYEDFAGLFPQAGVYSFGIGEGVFGGTSTELSRWQYSPGRYEPIGDWHDPESDEEVDALVCFDAQYTLRVWVKNDPNDITKRKYAQWALIGPDGNKVEVSNDEGEESGADFASRYTARSTLNISKEVSGDYASTTYAFPQQITLYLPDWAAEESVSAKGPDGSALTPASGAGTATRVYNVGLAHGQTASFKVPVGTRYQVVEDPGNATVYDGARLSYEPSMEWNVDDEYVMTAPYAVRAYGDVYNDESGEWVETSIDTRTDDDGWFTFTEDLLGEDFLSAVGDGDVIALAYQDDNGDYRFICVGDTVFLDSDIKGDIMVESSPYEGTVEVIYKDSLYDSSLKEPTSDLIPAVTVSADNSPLTIADYPSSALSATQTFLGWTAWSNVDVDGNYLGFVSAKDLLRPGTKYTLTSLAANFRLYDNEPTLVLYPVIADSSKQITVNFYYAYDESEMNEDTLYQSFSGASGMMLYAPPDVNGYGCSWHLSTAQWWKTSLESGEPACFIDNMDFCYWDSQITE